MLFTLFKILIFCLIYLLLGIVATAILLKIVGENAEDQDDTDVVDALIAWPLALFFGILSSFPDVIKRMIVGVMNFIDKVVSVFETR